MVLQTGIEIDGEWAKVSRHIVCKSISCCLGNSVENSMLQSGASMVSVVTVWPMKMNDIVSVQQTLCTVQNLNACISIATSWVICTSFTTQSRVDMLIKHIRCTRLSKAA